VCPVCCAVGGGAHHDAQSTVYSVVSGELTCGAAGMSGKCLPVQPARFERSVMAVCTRPRIVWLDGQVTGIDLVQLTAL
jgi:hypothetical protein